MEVTLIYNPNSGIADRVTADELAQSLIGAGFTPVYEATSSVSDLDPILPQAQGPVVITGGDGSVRAVASRLIDRQAGMAIVPFGTANNIARAL